MYTTTTVMTVVAALAAVADAHVAMFHPAMFGFDYPNQNKWPYTDGDRDANYGNNRPNNPLRAAEAHPESFWLGNGLRDYPPPPNVFAEIPSGGVATYDTGGDRSKTRWRKWDMGQELAEYCTDSNFNMHTINDLGKTPNLEYLGGTAIAIAYTSDANAVKGEDFTVISVNWASPWHTRPTFPMPRGMPPCPPGGCLCTWNWIHTAGNKHPVTGQGEGYGSEIYNTLFRCMVTGDTDSNNVIPKGAVPTACSGEVEIGGGELTNCTTGPKVPMYLWQGDGNNIFPPDPTDGWKNPTYNWRYGFKDGAQQDAVVPRGKEADANGKGSVGREHRDDLFEEGKGGMAVVDERGEPLPAGRLSAFVEKLLTDNSVLVQNATEGDIIGNMHVAVGVDGADVNAGVDAANPETMASSSAPEAATSSGSESGASVSASGTAVAGAGSSAAVSPSASGNGSSAAPSSSGAAPSSASSSGSGSSAAPSSSGSAAAAPSSAPSGSASAAPSASASGSSAATPSSKGKGKAKCKRSRRRRNRLA